MKKLLSSLLSLALALPLAALPSSALELEEAKELLALHYVDGLAPEILEMAGGAGTWRGTGGMATKLSAARIAMEAGCDMVIANGARMEDLYGIVEGGDVGTRFIAAGKGGAL